MFVMLLFASSNPDQPLQAQKFINPLLMKRNDCIQIDLSRRDGTTDTTLARISSQMIKFPDCVNCRADSSDIEGMELEQLFLNTLNGTVRFAQQGNYLTLYDENGIPLLNFVAVYLK